MGVSWNHTFTVITKHSSKVWAEHLAKSPVLSIYPGIECPLRLVRTTQNTAEFTTDGYNIVDLNVLEYPPDTLQVVHRIQPCQGQDFDVVDAASPEELYTYVYDNDGDIANEQPLVPYEGLDPDSDYYDYDANQHLNILATDQCLTDEEIEQQQSEDYENLVKLWRADATGEEIGTITYHSDKRAE